MDPWFAQAEEAILTEPPDRAIETSDDAPLHAAVDVVVHAARTHRAGQRPDAVAIHPVDPRLDLLGREVHARQEVGGGGLLW